MHTPSWRNIIKILVQKNRYILTYMSVFFILMFSVIVLSSFKPTYKNNSKFNPGIDDTIYVYDTVYYYDTTYYYDTVFIANKKTDSLNIEIKKSIFPKLFKNRPTSIIKANENKKILNNNFLFSVDLSISPLFFKHSFSSDFIYKDASQYNKSSIQEELSNTFGVGLNYHHKNVTLGSGIFFSKFNESFNYLVEDYLIDTILAYRFFTTTKMKIDTIEFFNIDSLLIGDTVIEYYYDTTRITTLDSTLVPKIDSVSYKKNDKASNLYRFVEIPLIFNFNIYKPNLTISPQIGIITSFFVNSKGKIVSLANINQSVDIEKETRFSKVNLSIYGGVKLNYFISKRLDFFSSAYFRKNLNSIFIDYPIISRINAFGLSFGLRYKMIY